MSHNLIAAVQFSLIQTFRNSDFQKIKSNRLIIHSILGLVHVLDLDHILGVNNPFVYGLKIKIFELILY